MDQLLKLNALASLVQEPEKLKTWTPGSKVLEFTSKLKQQKVGGLHKKQVIKLIQTLLASTQDEGLFTDEILDKLGGETENAILKLKNTMGKVKIEERAACNSYTTYASRRLLVRLLRLFCSLSGSILADSVPNKTNTFAEFTVMCIENWQKIVSARKVTLQDLKIQVEEGIAEAAVERTDMLKRIPMLKMFFEAGDTDPSISGTQMLEQLQHLKSSRSTKALALSDAKPPEKIEDEKLAAVEKRIRKEKSKKTRTPSTSSSTSSSTLSRHKSTRRHRKKGNTCKETNTELANEASQYLNEADSDATVPTLPAEPDDKDTVA
jgi:hypothetical protein